MHVCVCVRGEGGGGEGGEREKNTYTCMPRINTHRKPDLLMDPRVRILQPIDVRSKKPHTHAHTRSRSSTLTLSTYRYIQFSNDVKLQNFLL